MPEAVAAEPKAPCEVHASAGGGWDLVGSGGGKHCETLRDALDSALAVITGGRSKPVYLRNPDTGEADGAWRWLPACEEEDAPIKGVRIDAEALREAAASLNARPTAIAIDGGPTPPGMLPSEVHGTPMTGGATPANGWAHWAVCVVNAAQRTELYLYGELVPVVARELDAGRIGAGSVDLRFQSVDGDAPRGVELASFALTNDPAVKTLMPPNSQRAAEGALFAVRTYRLASTAVLRGKAPIMSKTKAKKKTLRGPATDAEAKLFALFGLDPADEDSDCDLIDAVFRVMQAADLEEAVDAINGVAPLEAPEEMAGTQAAALHPPEPSTANPTLDDPSKSKPTKSHTTDIPLGQTQASVRAAIRSLTGDTLLAKALRAIDGLTQEQQDTWATQVLAALQDIFGMPDGSAADVMAALQGQADKIKGALAAQPTDAPPADAPTDATKPGDAAPTAPTPGGDAATMSAGTPDATARANTTADLVALRTEVTHLRTQNEVAQKRVAELEEREARRTLGDTISERFAKASRTLAPQDRDDLVSDLLALPDGPARERTIERALRAAVGGPLVSSVMTSTTASSVGGTQTGEGESAIDADTAVTRATEALKKEGLRGPELHAKAYERARKDHPSAFRRSAN